MPEFMSECLLAVSPDQMFRLAKHTEGRSFHEFHEWIDNYLKKVMYDVDNRFVELEEEHMKNARNSRNSATFRQRVQDWNDQDSGNASSFVELDRLSKGKPSQEESVGPGGRPSFCG